MSHPAWPSSGLARCLLPHSEPLARPGRSTLPCPTPTHRAESWSGCLTALPGQRRHHLPLTPAGGLAPGDRQGQGSDRPMSCLGQGPRIAWALPSQGGLQTGQGSGCPHCLGEGESDPPRQAHSGPEADALSLVGTEDTPSPPLWSDSGVTAPALSWRSEENSRQPPGG